MRIMWVFLNDDFVLKEEAKVSIYDLGFMRSYGIFEFMRLYDAHIFCLSEHLERFFASAKTLQIKIPYSMDELKALCLQLVEKNEMKDTGLKIVLSGGVGDFAPVEPTIAILPASLRAPTKPLKIATKTYERFMPHCKTLYYLPAILAREEVKRAGFDEPLFLDQSNCILEGARENFFAIKGEKIITPSNGVLHGVTRSAVLDMAEVEVRTFPYNELSECDGAFFTSTVREIAPIAQIDDIEFGVPDIILELQSQFKDRVSPALQK